MISLACRFPHRTGAVMAQAQPDLLQKRGEAPPASAIAPVRGLPTVPPIALQREAAQARPRPERPRPTDQLSVLGLPNQFRRFDLIPRRHRPVPK
jgi:hypothetical protein